MTSWKNLLARSVTSGKELAAHLPVHAPDIDRVAKQWPMRINPYYLELIKKHGHPLFRQAVPDRRELEDSQGLDDPLAENRNSPVPNLVHKYPDRALFLVCNECAMYCRFCTRKRLVGQHSPVSHATIEQGIEYLRNTPAIREVLLSGGDPLLLTDNRLGELLGRLRAIPSIEIIRIGSRVPCTLPMRITPELIALLKQYQPLYINTHFNHPAELTPEASRTCTTLADAGIPVGCQTVLLKGVNDTPEIIEELMRGLLRIRVRPYYLFQMDLARGTSHFRTRIETGQAIMRHLIANVSGLAIPTFALDAPDGSGKIPLTPSYIGKLGKDIEFTTLNHGTCFYPNR